MLFPPIGVNLVLLAMLISSICVSAHLGKEQFLAFYITGGELPYKGLPKYLLELMYALGI